MYQTEALREGVKRITISDGSPAGFGGAGEQGCKNCADCELLKTVVLKNSQLQQECDTVLKVMDFLLSLTELWAKHNGFIPSGSGSKEDIEKELADGKGKVRTLFNDLIKTGEPAFIDRLFGALNIPKDCQHFL